MISLYPHQVKATVEAIKRWSAGDTNVLVVLPTGAGKTLVKAWFAKRSLDAGEPCLVLAHRDVLLLQISMAMCMLKVRHSFICATHTVREITNFQMELYGESFFDETSPVIVASVDTFNARIKKDTLKHLFPLIKLWMLDEAHHMLVDNKWGRCVEPLINSRGLGVTATPMRGDKKGLGRHVDGVFDSMFVGATMGELIEIGRLSPYKIYVPPTSLDMTGVNVTSSGDYNQKKLAERTDNATITGDAVKHYLKLANGKQAITFTVNIAHSEHVAAEFNRAGISSVAVSSKTPTKQREQYLIDFKKGLIKNLVNCDLFGEGFDVPSVYVVIGLRKTDSFGLFKQHFGRMLRVLEGKDFGIYIDHVGNIKRHCIYGAPHDDPEWTLDAYKKINGDNEKPEGRVCPECFNFYTPTVRNKFVCKDCNHEETKEEINQQQQEFLYDDNNLVEMNIDFINTLLSERNKVDRSIEIVERSMINAPQVVRNSAVKNHRQRQNAQSILREKIQDWCFVNACDNDWEIKTTQMEFESRFGINILKAQVLGERQAFELLEKMKP